jgi:beta-alanine--pyruvate transaminase
LTPREGAVGARGYDLVVDCFEQGLLTRASGDTIALSPPLIVEPEQFDTMVATIGDALARLA